MLIGDWIGRKKALFTAVSLAVPCLFLGGFVASYEMYILLKFVSCIAIVFGWIAGHNYHVIKHAKFNQS